MRCSSLSHSTAGLKCGAMTESFQASGGIRALQQAIACARAAVLLISQPFLDLAFITGEELPALREKLERRVFPVLLRPCEWNQQPLLGSLQFVPDPKRPIVGARDPEGQITRVCLKLLELIPAAAPGPTVVGGNVGEPRQPPAVAAEPARSRSCRRSS